jgi:hypothetical protein
MYWDFTPPKILENCGFRSTRETAAKIKACQSRGTDNDGHKDVKATAQRIQATEFAAKSAMSLQRRRGRARSRWRTKSFCQRRRERSSLSWTSRNSRERPSPCPPVSFARSLKFARGTTQIQHQCGRITRPVREPGALDRTAVQPGKRQTPSRRSSTSYGQTLCTNSRCLSTFLNIHQCGQRSVRTIADLVRTLRSLGVPRRSSASQFRCCKRGV